MTKVSVIMLTNYGYRDFVDNCTKSMEMCGFDKKITIYCLDDESVEYFSPKYTTIHVRDLDNFRYLGDTEKEVALHKTRKFTNIVHHKLLVIGKELRDNDYVLFVDGDIVIENNEFLNFCLEEIEDKELLIQSEKAFTGEDGDYLCSGFMLIKSTSNTVRLFDSVSGNEDQDDQDYINANKHKINYKTLPLDLFPNGRYYYKNSNKIKPFIIHFNWVIGNEKRKKMMNYSKWYL